MDSVVLRLMSSPADKSSVARRGRRPGQARVDPLLDARKCRTQPVAAGPGHDVVWTCKPVFKADQQPSADQSPSASNLEHTEPLPMRTSIAVMRTRVLDEADEIGSIPDTVVKYHVKNCLDYNDVIEDGFYDPGRARSELQPLRMLHADPIDDKREVVLVDRRVDFGLQKLVDKVQHLLEGVHGARQRAKIIALAVSNSMGGSHSCLIEAADDNALKKHLGSNVIGVGDLTYGVCRHRSLTFKYLADRFGVTCRVLRGHYFVGDADDTVEAHAWNIVLCSGEHYLCDVMHDPGNLYPENSAKAHAYRRTEKEVTDGKWYYMGGAGMVSIPMSMGSATIEGLDWSLDREYERLMDINSDLSEEISSLKNKLRRTERRLEESRATAERAKARVQLAVRAAMRMVSKAAAGQCPGASTRRRCQRLGEANEQKPGNGTTLNRMRFHGAPRRESETQKEDRSSPDPVTGALMRSPSFPSGPPKSESDAEDVGWKDVE